jgi:hypothetical protein
MYPYWNFWFENKPSGNPGLQLAPTDGRERFQRQAKVGGTVGRGGTGACARG